MEKAPKSRKRRKPFKIIKINVTASVKDGNETVSLKQYLKESPKGTKILIDGEVMGVKS